MKKIKLTQNKYALVDDGDFRFLNQWKWYIGSHGYALRKTHIGSVKDGSRKEVIFLMHRVINKTPKGFDTDHINRNKLDNRKDNLRTVTRQKNALNVGLLKNNTSGHKGISLDKRSGRWETYITVNYKKMFLGYYDNLFDAIKARKKAETIHHTI